MPRDLAGRKRHKRSGVEHVRKPKEDPRPKDSDGKPIETDNLLALYQEEYTNWDEQTIDDRDESIRYRDFYDGIQWTEDEVDELLKRLQPILVKNLIAPKVNFVLGSETENRVSPKAYPRTSHHDIDAEIVTDGLRYVTDADDFGQTRSKVASDIMVEGYGGAIFSIDSEREDGSPVISLERIFWDRLYYDPRSRKHDFSDAKYMGAIVWMYKDEAEEEFLDHLERDSDEYQRIQTALAASYHDDISFGDTTQDAPRRVQTGGSATGGDRVQFFETYRKTDGQWMKAIWSWAGWIVEPEVVGGTDDDGDTWGFLDEEGNTFCPMIIESGFIDRNNARYGIVKHMISPQEEVNKRASKALHLIHNDRIVYEEGAIQAPDEFAAQLGRPDGAAKTAPGRLRDKSVQILPNTELAMAQVQLGQQAEAAINQIGPHAALVAADTRIQSGKAFMARQRAGDMEIKPIFDHLRHWTLRAFRCYWWLIRQTWREEKWIRVRDDSMQREFRFVAFNEVMTKAARMEQLIEKETPQREVIKNVLGDVGTRTFKILQKQAQDMQREQQQVLQMVQQAAQQSQQTGQPLPPQIQQLAQQASQVEIPDPFQQLLQTEMAQEEFTANDVAKLDVDIVLDVIPNSPIMRHEQFSEIVNLVSTTLQLVQDPKVIQLMLANVIEMSDLRDDEKRKFVDALMPEDEDPEAAQQQQQLQQQQMALTLAEMKGKVVKLESEAAKNQAQAEKVSAETQVSVPAAAQLSLASADQAKAQADLAAEKGPLTQAQTLKTVAEAEAVSEQDLAPKGAGGLKAS